MNVIFQQWLSVELLWQTSLSFTHQVKLPLICWLVHYLQPLQKVNMLLQEYFSCLGSYRGLKWVTICYPTGLKAYSYVTGKKTGTVASYCIPATIIPIAPHRCYKAGLSLIHRVEHLNTDTLIVKEPVLGRSFWMVCVSQIRL